MAVAILAFTATAAIKLVILGQNSLSETKEHEMLLDQASIIQIGIRTGEIDKSGVSGDFTWDTADKEREFFDENFGKLKFDKQPSENIPMPALYWRELTVKHKDKNKIVLLIPSDKAKDKDILETLSKDKKTASNDKK